MEDNSQDERELRAARNQAMFRAVNEKLRDLNETFGSLGDEFVIICECADPICVRTLTIVGDEYMGVRANPRHFAVLPGHVYPDVESVVNETDGYVVVEKIAKAAELVEEFSASEDHSTAELGRGHRSSSNMMSGSELSSERSTA